MNAHVLKTRRLILRPPVPSDAEAIQRHVSERRVAETTALIPHPYPDGGALDWIRRVEVARQAGDRHDFVICLRGSGELIGVISILQDPDDVALGYWIGVPHWRQGYASEALHRVIRFGFNRLGLPRFHACHFAHNPASGRVMQKAGLLFEGVESLGCTRGGERFDRVCYGISADEWRARLHLFSQS